MITSEGIKPYDNTGNNCAQKQNGPVWFLAGIYKHPVDRVLPTVYSNDRFRIFRIES
jgi:hypothetical protein